MSAIDLRQRALKDATPENLALVSAVLYVGDQLSAVANLLETLDTSVSNGLAAIARELE
jgi:hypothetical protein